MARQDEPARGRAGQAALLPAARAGGCTPGKPLSCLRQGRGGLHPGQAAFLPAARAGGVAPRTSRFLAYGKSGSSVSSLGRKYANVHGKPTLSLRLTAGRSCPLFKLVAIPREGAVPPSIPSKGALPPRPPKGGAWPHGTSRLLACGKGGGVAPRASRLLAYGKGGCVTARDKPPSCVPQGREFRFCTWVETRERASMTHTARASASGPKREAKFFAPLSFKKAGEAGEIGRGIGSVL